MSSSGDMATISWMLRAEWGPGRGRGVPGWDSPPDGSSEGGLAPEDWGASGSPGRPFTDSSAELSGDSGAGLQLADVLGVPSGGERRRRSMRRRRRMRRKGWRRRMRMRRTRRMRRMKRSRRRRTRRRMLSR